MELKERQYHAQSASISAFHSIDELDWVWNSNPCLDISLPTLLSDRAKLIWIPREDLTFWVLDESQETTQVHSSVFDRFKWSCLGGVVGLRTSYLLRRQIRDMWGGQPHYHVVDVDLLTDGHVEARAIRVRTTDRDWHLCTESLQTS